MENNTNNNTSYCFNYVEDWEIYLGQIEVMHGKDTARIVKLAFMKLSDTFGDYEAAQRIVNAINDGKWAAIRKTANA